MGFMDGLAQGYGQGSQLGVSMLKDMRDEDMRKQALAQADAEKKAALNRQLENDAYAKAQDERNYQLKLKELSMKGNGAPNGMKLKPGERYNPKTDTVEIVPGSDLYQQNANKYSKDAQALSGVKQKTQGGLQAVDEFLNKPGALESQFGKGYTGLVSKYFDPNAKKALEQIKATVRSSGLDMMRSGGSIGQMTEREWPMVEQLMANIDNSLSEDEARFQLEKVKAKLKNIQEQADQINQQEWGNTQFAHPMRTDRAGVAPQAPAAPSKRYQILGVE